MRIIDTVFVPTGGGPGVSTGILTPYACDESLEKLNLGYTSALSFAFLAIVLVRRDYNGVRIFFIWLRNITVMWGAYEWGGATVSPFNRGEPPEREIPDHAF